MNVEIIQKLPSGYKYYKKIPIITRAVQINKEFLVKTLEGIVKGKAGDYILEGVHNELYVCDKTIFEKTYNEVNVIDNFQKFNREEDSNDSNDEG